ncbi:hypothetical protein GsuE55_30900 [Geobacillus subterraneus]|uniref:Uncharacterized protein n=1 Tax=Geobacillus subterraneus TaxID=129338 RepID=A0A679FVM0_9BACL|nr:hypothetical protein GsuE55_30900 [Geobacillus subterraneus]
MVMGIDDGVGFEREHGQFECGYFIWDEGDPFSLSFIDAHFIDVWSGSVCFHAHRRVAGASVAEAG